MRLPLKLTEKGMICMLSIAHPVTLLLRAQRERKDCGAIQAAINGNVGGMGTPAWRPHGHQVQAIAEALVTRQAAPSVAISMPFLPKTFTYEPVDFPVMSSKPASPSRSV